ncbi:hypothetical protein psal_cds_635 [Pandoravirus salinus]|uniref:Uncharacterized protein n=1 Tax=Pandoravirus salinus TaxID=1349410 RepID=S4W2U5_9VIRU|nr:hypothetical protein psal_cds_635 [Pandoravirus salinus]AGO84525.2 hypothetical protein psal_cds_635 [Pandoravirus salinus]
MCADWLFDAMTKKRYKLFIGRGRFTPGRGWRQKGARSAVLSVFSAPHLCSTRPRSDYLSLLLRTCSMPSSVSIEINCVGCALRRRSRSASLPLPIRRDPKTVASAATLTARGTERTMRSSTLRTTAASSIRARRKRTNAFLVREPNAASRALADVLYC